MAVSLRRILPSPARSILSMMAGTRSLLQSSDETSDHQTLDRGRRPVRVRFLTSLGASVFPPGFERAPRTSADSAVTPRALVTASTAARDPNVTERIDLVHSPPE